MQIRFKIKGFPKNQLGSFYWPHPTCGQQQ